MSLCACQVMGHCCCIAPLLWPHMYRITPSMLVRVQHIQWIAEDTAGRLTLLR